jgi:mono/diheme cytochrome c family protein
MKWLKWPTLFAGILMVVLAPVARAQTKPTINKEPAKATPADSGAEMFKTYCAVCHGPNGKGTGPAAAALKKQPADLTQLAKRNGGQFPAIKVSLFIKGDEIVASHGSRDMPIWGKIFNEMDGDKVASLRIRNLTEYVQSLQEK